MHDKVKESDFHISMEGYKKDHKESLLKARYMAVFAGFMGEFFLYFHRITVSISIVSMVNRTTGFNEIDYASSKSCPNLIKKNQEHFIENGSFGYSVCVLGIYFADCNRTFTLVLSLSALSFVGFCFAGSWVASTDMSPTFSGSINAIACFIGSLSHFIMPVAVGHLTNESQTIEQWQKIFLICIGVSLSSGLVFALFGSAEIQPWNDVSDTNVQQLKEEKTRY